MKKRALLSVSDKTGVVDFAKGLAALGYEIVSTGGTFATLEKAGVPVISVDSITGFPECLDGRVKTLHPLIHAGVLAMRGNKEHMAQLEKLNVTPIDVIAVNLYPFKATIEKPGVTFAEAIENIDIGGPTMLRAAAKNYQDVLVVCDPTDYAPLLAALRENTVTLQTKLDLCHKVFAHTAHYDAMISNYLFKNTQQKADFPQNFTPAFEMVSTLRYGENPHQKAAVYAEQGSFPGSLLQAGQLWGKELSYNNYNDTNGALELLREFTTPAVVAVKHANPCGVGCAGNIDEAYLKAYEADPVSIFGGIIAANRPIGEETARRVHEIFVEIVVAPDFTPEALAILQQKKNLRILKLASIGAPWAQAYEYKKIYGGLLVQDRDDLLLNEEELSVVTDRTPTEEEMADLLMAWKLVKHTKSNGIAIAKNGQSLGIGPGQVNRIWATEAALQRSGERVKGAAMASDAFFPFDDCVKAAAAAGITAIIQPGGSVRDADSVAAANKAGIAMVVTGCRHFKH